MDKRQLEKLVKRYVHKRAKVVRNRSAPDRYERDRCEQLAREYRAEMESLKAERRKLGRWEWRLLEAAKFVCDVDGDNPSIPRLAEVVKEGERRRWIDDRLEELENMRRGVLRLTVKWPVEVRLYGMLAGIPFQEIKYHGHDYEDVAKQIVLKHPDAESEVPA